MKIDFCTPLIGLDNKPLQVEEKNGITKELTVGFRLATSLGRDAESPDATKFVGWALQIMQGKPVDLDKSDQEKLIKWVDSNGGSKQMPFFSAIEQFRIKECIEKAQEKAK